MEVDIPTEEPVEEPAASPSFAPRLSQYFITPDKPQLVFQDLTGVYGPENLGGYGAPNPERSALAIQLLCRYKAIAGDEVLAFAAYSPILESVTTEEPQAFVLDLPQDGWIQLSALYFPALAAVIIDEIPEGKVIYDLSLNALRRKKDGEMVPVTLEEAELDAAYSVVVNEFPVVHNAYFKEKQGEICTNLIPHTLEDDSCFELDRAMRQYNIHNIGLASAVWAFCKGERYVAQGNIEVLNKIITKAC